MEKQVYIIELKPFVVTDINILLRIPTFTLPAIESVGLAGLLQKSDIGMAVERKGLNMLEPMKHQVEAVEHCRSQRSTLVACAIGTGKTYIGIGCLDPEKKSLVVVPASLKHNWVKEIGLWEPSWDVELADKDAPKSGVRVCSYNDLVDLWGYRYDIVVADEAHYVKNPNAKRTQRMQHILDNAERVVLMTATPALNNVSETKNLLALMGYPDTPNDPLRLNEYMVRNGLMVRVRLSDIMDIVEPEFCRINVELHSVGEIVRLTDEIRNLYASVGSDFGKMWDEYRPVLVGMLTQIRKHVGVAKIADAVVEIDAQVKAGRNIIVFAHHRHVLESLAETFDAPLLYGSTSLRKRHELVQEFQDGKHKVIICSILAAGVGITLTKAHHVMFVEFPWTPADYDQAYGRAHRKGQTEQVHVIDLVANHRVDQRHMELLAQKRGICDSITDGDPQYSASTMQKTLIQSIVEAV